MLELQQLRANASGKPLIPARCRLLDLPYEIRCHIYECVLCKNAFISVVTFDRWVLGGRNRGKRLADGLGLFRCCKTISTESLALLYRQNTFVFPTEWDIHWTGVYRFFAERGPINRSNILRIVLVCPIMDTICQYPDGSRIDFGTGDLKFYAYDPKIHARKVPCVDTVQVQHIHPAIRPIFQLIGNDRPILNMMIMDLTKEQNFSQDLDPEDRKHVDDRFWSGDVPILMIKCIREFNVAKDGTVLVRLSEFNGPMRAVVEKKLTSPVLSSPRSSQMDIDEDSQAELHDENDGDEDQMIEDEVSLD